MLPNTPYRKFTTDFAQHRLLLFITSLLISSISMAATPESIPGSLTVASEDLINLIGDEPELVIVDARIQSDRLEGFIEGSISLSNIDTNCDTLEEIIKSFESPVLFYCNGVNCDRSKESTETALACGYSNVYWFRGGIEEWKNKQYPIVRYN